MDTCTGITLSMVGETHLRETGSSGRMEMAYAPSSPNVLTSQTVFHFLVQCEVQLSWYLALSLTHGQGASVCANAIA